jgi:two-component sensor histidine kinase
MPDSVEGEHGAVAEDALPADVDAPPDRAAAILATIPQPLLVLDRALTVEFANPAFFERFAVAPDETLGRPLYELAEGRWHIPELHGLLEGVLDTEGRARDQRIEHDFGRRGRGNILLHARRIVGGGPERILLTVSEVTEPRRLLLGLEGHRELAEALVDSVQEGLVVLGRDLRARSANRWFHEAFELDPDDTEGRPIYELGHGQWNIPRLRELLEEVLPRQGRFDDLEIEHEFARIGRRTMLLGARRLDHGQLILLAIRDVTAARRAEAQREALVGELQHRVKNILSVVRALVAQTRQRNRAFEAYFLALDARLRALGRAQDLLVGSPLEKVPLADLVRRELQASGGEEGKSFSLSGPPVRVSPRAAQAMAMTIHELATNAAKHGALSVGSGRIEIAWRLERRKASRHLCLSWRERGLQIRDTAPRRGFGAQMIEDGLPYALGGISRLTFHADGAECAIEIPLPEA